MTTAPARFDASLASGFFFKHGHSGWLGLRYSAQGDNWVELELPWRADLLSDAERPVLASGPIVSLMDMASGMAIWQTGGTFMPIVTLDLRVDYQRPAREGAAVRGRVECYRITRSAAFVRGIAHDGDPADPVAHVAGVFMTIEGDPGQSHRPATPPPSGGAAAGAGAAAALSGHAAAPEPPSGLTNYAGALGLRPVGEYEGLPVLAVDFGPSVEGRPGHFHGGAMAGLLESAGYGALQVALAAEGRALVLKPINITVQYLAAGRARPAFAAARISRLGRRNANLAVEAWQDDRARPIATAVMNVLMV